MAWTVDNLEATSDFFPSVPPAATIIADSPLAVGGADDGLCLHLCLLLMINSILCELKAL